MRTRTGKIARLPLALREELNRRLLENEPARSILAWLNGLEEMQTIIREMGEAGGHVVGACDDKNLSDWRRGGYADWLRRRERIEDTRELAQWSVKLARASGGNISEGASAILSGHLMELLEGLADLKAEGLADNDRHSVSTPERSGQDSMSKRRLAEIAEVVDQVSKALANVRKGDHDREKLDLERQRLAQGDRALALEQEKFRRSTCELFVRWAEDERAKAIATGSGSNAEKIEALGQLMFGEDWDAKTPSK